MKRCLSGVVCICFLLGSASQEQSFPSGASLSNSSMPLEIAPDHLDFGTLPVGTLSQPQTVALINHGDSILVVSGIITSGIDFAQTDTCGASLASASRCAIQVTFKPAITGPRLGQLSIMISDPHGFHSVPLVGTGQ
jgi:hypothetical protein